MNITPEQLAKLLVIGRYRDMSSVVLEKFIEDMPVDIQEVARAIAGGSIPFNHLSEVLAVRKATEKR
jgi:hypothetical protein